METNLEDITLSKISQAQKINTVSLHLPEVSKMVHVQNPKSNAGERKREWEVII